MRLSNQTFMVEGFYNYSWDRENRILFKTVFGDGFRRIAASEGKFLLKKNGKAYRMTPDELDRITSLSASTKNKKYFVTDQWERRRAEKLSAKNK